MLAVIPAQAGIHVRSASTCWNTLPRRVPGAWISAKALCQWIRDILDMDPGFAGMTAKKPKMMANQRQQTWAKLDPGFRRDDERTFLRDEKNA